jgi:uncharacterized protein YllA (UPF0747 family)
MLEAAVIDRNARLGLAARVGKNQNANLICKDLATIHECYQFLLKNYVHEEDEKEERKIFENIQIVKANPSPSPSPSPSPGPSLTR